MIKGTIATGITQPVDVMKTRLMEAKPGQYKVQYILPHVRRKISLPCLIFTLVMIGPEGTKETWSQFNKTFTRVIYNCSHCFRV